MEKKNESFTGIPPELVKQIDAGREMLEISDTGIADSVARRFGYRIERFSERRDAWLLVLRKK